MPKHNENKTWAFALTFIGSLLYLYSASAFAQSVSPSNGLFSGAGGFFLPIFAGVAVICSVALFVGSFGILKGAGSMVERGIGQAALWGGISLVAIFIGSTMLWYVVLGFLLAMAGGVVYAGSK